MKRYVLVLLQWDGCLRPGVSAVDIPTVATNAPLGIVQWLDEPLRWWGLN